MTTAARMKIDYEHCLKVAHFHNDKKKKYTHSPQTFYPITIEVIEDAVDLSQLQK